MIPIYIAMPLFLTVLRKCDATRAKFRPTALLRFDGGTDRLASSPGSPDKTDNRCRFKGANHELLGAGHLKSLRYVRPLIFFVEDMLCCTDAG
jgi:hypothetical protein